ncbi:MAG: hypothetical protein AAGA21_14700 [Pseudomonadota bacterium]
MAHLKQQNRKQIIIYAAANFLAFSWVLGGGAFPQDWEGRIGAASTSAVVTGLITLVQLIYSGILGDKLKSAIVFWRFTNPLPGCRAFTEIAPSDPRIDYVRLKARIGDLPIEPEEQNRVWYRLYRQHENQTSVRDAHGNYLLARELACLSLAFALIFPVLAFVLGTNVTIAMLYAGVMLAVYLLIAYSGCNYGRRFVANVLAIEGAISEPAK